MNPSLPAHSPNSEVLKPTKKKTLKFYIQLSLADLFIL